MSVACRCTLQSPGPAGWILRLRRRKRPLGGKRHHKKPRGLQQAGAGVWRLGRVINCLDFGTISKSQVGPICFRMFHWKNLKICGNYSHQSETLTEEPYVNRDLVRFPLAVVSTIEFHSGTTGVRYLHPREQRVRTFASPPSILHGGGDVNRNSQVPER